MESKADDFKKMSLCIFNFLLNFLPWTSLGLKGWTILKGIFLVLIITIVLHFWLTTMNKFKKIMAKEVCLAKPLK